MATTQTTNAEDADPGRPRLNPWMVVALVLLVLVFVLPVLLLIAIQVLGSEASTDFSQIGSSIG